MNDASSDPWRLERFTAAQERGGTYGRALAELRAGAKASHWMWFVFPQVEGLGSSAMAREYAISSLAEARAYLAHPVLGPRLRECARVVAGTEGRSAERIFGPVDAMKLRSSMTLFDAAAEADPGRVGDAGADAGRAGDAGADAGVAGDADADAGEAGDGGQAGEAGGNVFRAVLAKYFGGGPDEATVARLLPLLEGFPGAYVHMIEEYARHNGHAGLLRERVDGTPGT